MEVSPGPLIEIIGNQQGETHVAVWAQVDTTWGKPEMMITHREAGQEKERHQFHMTSISYDISISYDNSIFDCLDPAVPEATPWNLPLRSESD